MQAIKPISSGTSDFGKGPLTRPGAGLWCNPSPQNGKNVLPITILPQLICHKIFIWDGTRMEGIPMLAEIFMVWLESLRRAQTTGLVKSSSPFVPFDQHSVGRFKAPRGQ